MQGTDGSQNGLLVRYVLDSRESDVRLKRLVRLHAGSGNDIFRQASQTASVIDSRPDHPWTDPRREYPYIMKGDVESFETYARQSAFQAGKPGLRHLSHEKKGQMEFSRE
jgi:hypothetical protein